MGYLVLICRMIQWLIALFDTLLAYFFITASVQSLYQARNFQVIQNYFYVFSYLCFVYLFVQKNNYTGNGAKMV